MIEVKGIYEATQGEYVNWEEGLRENFEKHPREKFTLGRQ